MSRYLEEEAGQTPRRSVGEDSGQEVGDVDAEHYYEPEPPKRSRWLAMLKSSLAVLIALGVLIGGGYFIYKVVSNKFQEFTSVQDYPGPGAQEIVVEIPSGATLTDMANILKDKDVVASAQAFLSAAKSNSGAASIQPGSYRMKTKMRAADALATLMKRENQVLNRVSIPEGLNNAQVVDRLSKGTKIAAEQFNTALANPGALGLPAWAGGKTEGFLFPNTYDYGQTPKADAILGQMTKQFVTVTNEIGFQQKAAALGITPYDAVTIASIIERETRNPADGPKVARVIFNRLAQGMKLQMDSTVHYAANSYGEVTTTDDQRANPSPYNTYKHVGLPPGAISNPGRNALNSAVNPAAGDYLYFVTVNPDTGETKFASDYAEHEKNRAEFQAWCRANSNRCG